eukprot:s1205_g14.t1
MASATLADPTSTPASGPVLPIADSPSRDPSDTGDVADSDSNASHLSTRPPSGDRPPAMSSTGLTAPSRDLLRNWAPVDDQELISYKRDAKARPSWKTIGQRLHRTPESCRARWLWLQASGIDHTNVLNPDHWTTSSSNSRKLPCSMALAPSIRNRSHQRLESSPGT